MKTKRAQGEQQKIYMRDLARWAEVHRITLWRWLRPHRARLVGMGYRPGKPLPEAVINYVCDWFVIEQLF
ncbi:MAG: hypothetical protein PUC50_15255 [Bacteroidales bacterium]|nr:hypothetical protein [Bacteroidales bacterium]